MEEKEPRVDNVRPWFRKMDRQSKARESQGGASNVRETQGDRHALEGSAEIKGMQESHKRIATCRS
jgi:hypothetical protein